MTGELEAQARRLAGAARPGEQIEVCLSAGTSTTVRVHGGEVESLSVADGAGAGIRVIVGHRQGFASCGTLEGRVLDEVLAEARDNAAFGEPDDWLGVAEPDGVAPVAQDHWREALLAMPTTAKATLALELERRVRTLDARITGVRTATYADGHGELAVANSCGLSGTSRATHCSLSVVALADDGDGRLRTGVGVSVGREPAELDLDAAAADAVARTVRMLGARRIPSADMRLVLEPRLAAVLLGITAATLTGERLVKGRTPFAGRSGEAIAATALTLIDDPTDTRSMGADAIDGEGLACRRNVLVERGVLRGFLHDTYTGRRTGAGSTGSAVRGARSLPVPGPQALAVVPGTRSFEEILADQPLALWVQSFAGLHSGVNAVSGDVSVGVEAVVVRDGEPAEPVGEITAASTLQRMLLGIVEVGADLTWLPGGTGAATMVVDGARVSGT